MKIMTFSRDYKGKKSSMEPMGPKAQAVHDYKLYVHKHNGLFGTCKLIEALLSSLERSESVTYDGKCALARIWRDLNTLKEEVYTFRVEPNGTIKRIRHEGDEQLKQWLLQQSTEGND